MLLLLHSAFMLSVVKMLLKGEFGGHVLNSHGIYIVDCGKSWKNHGIVFFNFCGNPAIGWSPIADQNANLSSRPLRVIARQTLHLFC